MIVKPITKEIANVVVSNKHYSRKLGIFWEGFGLYDNDVLIGVCCYGQPSAPIQKHAFKDRDFRLYELTRLVVDNGVKNAASFLISQSLKMLKEKHCAVVSYADSAHGHCGVVYQATNWIYTGATISHDKLYLVGDEKLHPMTLLSRWGITSPSKWANEKGIKVLRPLSKHRYFYFLGSKKQKKEMAAKLKYSRIANYPKANKTTYDAGQFPCAHYL